MDHDKEIQKLSAEIRTLSIESRRYYAERMALGCVLSFVLARLTRADPTLLPAIATGLDDAADFVEDFAIHKGKTVSSEQTAKALRIIEEIRATALGVP